MPLRQHVPTPEENRARNVARILNPPPRTLRDRVSGAAYRVSEWWWRRVSRRKLVQLLDRARLVRDPVEPPPGALDRLRADYARQLETDEP
ncbi:hypothetical protein [Streptomyces sp. HPF1205]|uniref:hypothetical protein n=1 Tax=Streptomyces sp. HPF1205 TaxID=2873262 RepID=UPI001CEC6848|nr:hypothetical protein [Streptomyces sp. HPF1205]